MLVMGRKYKHKAVNKVIGVQPFIYIVDIDLGFLIFGISVLALFKELSTNWNLASFFLKHLLALMTVALTSSNLVAATSYFQFNYI